MAKRRPSVIDDAILDKLLAGRDPSRVLESGGLLGDLKKALAERMLAAEMDHHLADEAEIAGGKHRNGYSPKTVTTDVGQCVLDIPRDRHGHFDPALIPKYQRRFPGFDDKIIALYARGMSTRDICTHVGELYGVGMSANLVSVVTEAVMEEVVAWQARPLESTYAIVYFDALRVKIRDEGMVRNKAVYLAIGLRCCGRKQRKALAAALRPVYVASSAEAAATALDAFEQGPWGALFPPIVASWRRHWTQVIPFFAFSPEVRKMIYTTNAIESLHSQVRKTIRNNGHFPNDEAATKLIYLSLKQIEAKWKNPAPAWSAAKAQLAIQFGERFIIQD